MPDPGNFRVISCDVMTVLASIALMIKYNAIKTFESLFFDLIVSKKKAKNKLRKAVSIFKISLKELISI